MVSYKAVLENLNLKFRSKVNINCWIITAFLTNNRNISGNSIEKTVPFVLNEKLQAKLLSINFSHILVTRT